MKRADVARTHIVGKLVGIKAAARTLSLQKNSRKKDTEKKSSELLVQVQDGHGCLASAAAMSVRFFFCRKISLVMGERNQQNILDTQQRPSAYRKGLCPKPQ